MSDLGPRRYRIVDGVATPIEIAPRWTLLRVVRIAIPVLCCAYAAALLGFWAATVVSPAEFWPVHLILYGPRWTAALPAILLIPPVAWLRFRWSGLALAVAVASFLGFWGFTVPWGNLLSGAAEPNKTLRVLTCNVQGKDLKIESLADLIKQTQPDVVCLQECHLADPLAVLGKEGWYFESSGEYFLASRFPILEFKELNRPDKHDRIIAVRARLSRPGNDIPIVCVHLMTPRRGLQPLIDTKAGGVPAFREIASVQRLESELLKRWVEGAPESVVLAGDFNLTAEHPLYRRDWSSYRDAFSCTGWGLGHTMFTRQIGLRIDHILCGPAWRPQYCEIGPDVGSAHVPVLADLVESQ